MSSNHIPPFEQRVLTARKLGAEAGERAEHRADVAAPGFTEQSLAYIRERVMNAANDSTFRGEELVNGMKLAGIRPPDDRAFGPIFKKAIAKGYIKPVGYVARVKGHGSAGGKLYAPGSGGDAC